MSHPIDPDDTTKETAEDSGKNTENAGGGEEGLKRGEKAKRHRVARQSEALRDNLRRRKAQTRGRRQKPSLMDD